MEDNSKGKERRRFVRLPVGVMIRITSEQDAEVFSTNYSGDLSMGGMFIKTFTPKPVGTPVTIRLPVPHPPGYGEVKGVVVYRQEPTGHGVKAGMGVSFKEIDPNARHALRQFITGNWRSLFEQPAFTDESSAVKAILHILDFLEGALIFPLKTNRNSRLAG